MEGYFVRIVKSVMFYVRQKKYSFYYENRVYVITCHKYKYIYSTIWISKVKKNIVAGDCDRMSKDIKFKS